tara:strand:- start:671 stop:1831 length:1161 start_codon:yes stop_codon:yes gene_type:complete
MSKLNIIILSASLMALGAFSIDTILPSISYLKNDFNFLPQNSHWIISSVFIGLGIGQLVFGPVSDSIGRRKTAIIGLIIFSVGCLLSITANDYVLFLITRFLQGLGSGAAVVVARAIARDFFEGRKLAQIMSLVTTIFILVPVLAPSIGQIIISISHWKIIFVFMLFLSITLKLFILFKYLESGKLVNDLRFSSIVRGFVEVFSSKTSRTYTIATGLIFGILVSFLNIAQPLFQEFLMVGKSFALYFGLGALSVGIGSIINSKLVIIVNPQKIVLFALYLTAIWGICFYCLILFNLKINLVNVMIFLIPVFFLFGLLYGNMNAIALTPMGHIAGTASAVIGTASIVIAVPIGSIIAYYYKGPIDMFVQSIVIISLINILLVRKVKY